VSGTHLLLCHGKVLTVDTTFSIKSALVVKAGKILAVGGNEVPSATQSRRKSIFIRDPGRATSHAAD
jgi:predicted amidohydrolase YtcJ